MVNIPNTKYITVKRDENGAVDVFVGGKPATTYRGEEIYGIKDVEQYFSDIQKENSDVAELHVLSSKTCGEYSEVGNPSFERGPNAWCRVKNNDGKLGGWVFFNASTSAANCAAGCAYVCASSVRAYAAFRRAVFGAVDINNAQGGTDRKGTNGAPVISPASPVIAKKITEGTEVYEMGDYKITVIVEKMMRQK